MRRIIVKAVIAALTVYQRFLSPLSPPSCRFYPTCSQYSIEAIKCYGLWKGALMSLVRVLRCNPFNPGGYDPLPPQ